MDKEMVEKIRSWFAMPKGMEAIGSLNAAEEIGKILHEAGYRLDPYPNGKSKDELIKRIEELEAERDRARLLLHEVIITSVILDQKSNEKTVEAIDRFLTETSLVKP